MKKSILLLSILILNFNIKINAQSPDVQNQKVICTFFNGCDDNTCCKIIKGGETCENTTFYSADGQVIIKCSSTVTTNCMYCEDLASNDPNYNMDIYIYDMVNYNIDYAKYDNTVKISNGYTIINVFDFNNYLITDSGRVMWHETNSNFVKIYTAEAKSISPFYNILTLDSVVVNLDSAFGTPLEAHQLKILVNKWLENDLKVIVAPNPVNSKFYIQTESSHPYLTITNKLILELYSTTGQLISKSNINANGKFEFNVPKDYQSGFIIYKIILDNSSITGKIEVLK
jgi:hypothetical protein